MDSFRIFAAAALAAAALVSSQDAGAQTAGAKPVAAAPRKDPHYGPPITLEQAKTASAAAAAEARKHGLESTIAVCDPSGELVYFEKANDSQYAAGDIAIGKCRAAARYRRSSKEISDTLKAGNLATLALPGAVMGDAGGIPIIVHGLIIGAIGSTGGEGDIVSRAGADAVK